MRIPAWLAFFVFLFPLAVLPLLFGEFVLHGLSKLHLSPEVALLVLFGMIATGFINIPVRRIKREEGVPHHPLAVFGLSHVWPHLQRIRQETIVAVNVGGCLIPVALAAYEIWHLSTLGPQAVGAATVAVTANAIVSYLIARPVPSVGIAMPGLVAPVVAAGVALFIAPDYAPPVAFVSGVIGPLVGADLLHSRDIDEIEVGVISIGGAGTFDGIVLSGIIAAYLS